MTVIVTGAAGGIGHAVADALTAAGTPVLAADLPDSRWPGLPPDRPVRYWEGDVADEDAVARLFREADGLTGLAHVAGVFHLSPFARTAIEDFARVQRVNAAGTFLVLREAVRAFAGGAPGSGSGAVVTVTSNAARVPRRGMAAYGASKAAATQLTRIAGLELAAHGVRANVVCPGSTDTRMQREMWGEDAEAGRLAVLRGDLGSHRLGIPLGRIAEPRDVAGAVRFLLSEEARHVTMQEIHVDGGAGLGP